MKRVVQSVLGWLLVAGCIAGLVFSFQFDVFRAIEEADPADQAGRKEVPQTVAVVKPQREPIWLSVRYTGMLHPFERHTLSFEAAGRVEGLNAKPDEPALDEGSRVSRGQVLARLDDTLLRAARDEAAALATKAAGDLARGEASLVRNPRALSEADLLALQTEAKLTAARLVRAEKYLADCLLISPVDGVISKRMLNPGTSVAPHTPVFEILEVDRLLVHFGVPESRIFEIQGGEPATVEVEGKGVYERISGDYPGKVHRISQAADDKTGLFVVEVLVDNPEGTLRPGLIVRTSILIRQVEGCQLPLETLVEQDKRAGLFIVDADQRARFQPIVEFAEQGEWLVVADDLPVGCPIVIRGQHRLVDGTLVAPHVIELPPASTDGRTPAPRVSSIPGGK